MVRSEVEPGGLSGGIGKANGKALPKPPKPDRVYSLHAVQWSRRNRAAGVPTSPPTRPPGREA